MIDVIIPRSYNLGDFATCLPVLSGLYKATGEKISFGICDTLGKIRGIKEFLLEQEMFCDVKFIHEKNISNDYIEIDDQDSEDIQHENIPMQCFKYANSIYKRYGIYFSIDEEFELNIPKLDIDYMDDKIIVGDRWSNKDDVSVDSRRDFYPIKNSGKLDNKNTYYLDYTQELLYNCALIKYNNNAFVSAWTGTAIMGDLMKKNQYVLWGDDIRNWVGKPIEHWRDFIFFKKRNTKTVYINDFIVE